jgi:hypothetical protein
VCVRACACVCVCVCMMYVWGGGGIGGRGGRKWWEATCASRIATRPIVHPRPVVQARMAPGRTALRLSTRQERRRRECRRGTWGAEGCLPACAGPWGHCQGRLRLRSCARPGLINEGAAAHARSQAKGFHLSLKPEWQASESPRAAGFKLGVGSTIRGLESQGELEVESPRPPRRKAAKPERR